LAWQGCFDTGFEGAKLTIFEDRQMGDVDLS
jgi:hypothetical protein